jgi:hypothetical protein
MTPRLLPVVLLLWPAEMARTSRSFVLGSPEFQRR